MENQNHIFFAAFNRLDNLCCDIYNESHGVTRYIEHMKAASTQESYRVAGWDMDLNRLIRLRGYRNKLAHGTSFYEPLATDEDIDWIENFYDRILRQDDPLAQAVRMNTARPQNTSDKSTGILYEPETEKSKESSESQGIMLLLAVLCICVAAIVFLLK